MPAGAQHDAVGGDAGGAAGGVGNHVPDRAAEAGDDVAAPAGEAFAILQDKGLPRPASGGMSSITPSDP